MLAQMDAAGVDKLIQITRGVMGFDNAYSLEGAAGHPDRIRVLVRFDVAAPDLEGRLRALRGDPGVVGVRVMTIARDEAPRFEDGSVAALWRAAEELGLPISLYAPDRSGLVAEIAERHPALPIVVDHAGLRVFDIFGAPPPLDDWPNLLALRRFPNVTIKVSALPEAAVDAPPFAKAQGLLRQVFETFGADRMMWGSNYPLTTQICSYRQAVEFIELCDFLGSEPKGKILAGTAATVFGLPATWS